MKKLLLFPTYIVSVFTGAKSFQDNPVIGARVLNILGLHVLRIVLAHMIWHLRQWPLRFCVKAEDRRAFREDGFIIKENFLPAAVFGELADGAASYHGDGWQCVQGNTITWRVLLSDDVAKSLPGADKLLRNKYFVNLLKYTSAKNERPLLYIQQIRNNFSNGDADPQKNLHTDTFHPTMKAWLFLEDVTEDMGPFTYVPGSHKLSLKRLKWEYRQSIRGRDLDDPYARKGSLRVMAQELTEMGYPSPRACAVKKNTLVIANTNGFHCRGQVAGDHVNRLEIWAISRTNPFNPLPVFWFEKGYAWRDRLINRYLEYKQEKAARAGKRASWQKTGGGVI